MRGRTACISIDLDALGHYAAIHGLAQGVLAPGGDDAVARLAPDRLSELLAELGVHGTFFAVGQDLLRQGPPDGGELAGAEPLRRAARAGHEIGNHSQHHRYDLAALTPERIAREVHGGAEAIAAVVGTRPVGFRAPGYTLSAPLLAAVHAAGHRYDSSTFPAVPYYLAKAAVMGSLRLRGRPSKALLDRPRVLMAPCLPYRPDAREPYARGGLPLWEIPISTAPGTRLPFIGTAVATLPDLALDLLYRSVRRRPILNLELHGIDLMDESDGAGPRLARAQRDLRIPAARKIARLRRLLHRISTDYEIVTLAELAERLERQSPPVL